MSNALVQKLLVMFYRGTISAEDAKKQLVSMYECSKITKSDYERALNIIP